MPDDKSGLIYELKGNNLVLLGDIVFTTGSKLMKAGKIYQCEFELGDGKFARLIIGEKYES
jgi:hypothetical protein